MYSDTIKKIIKIISGSNYTITPFLLLSIFLCKNIFLKTLNNNYQLERKITEEKNRTTAITLQFTKYQNHRKILDLHREFVTGYDYINSQSIINEEQIENL